MVIVSVFIDSNQCRKKQKQQNLLSLFGDKKINQSVIRIKTNATTFHLFSQTSEKFGLGEVLRAVC